METPNIRKSGNTYLWEVPAPPNLGVKSEPVKAAVPVLACLTIILDIPAMIIHSKNRNYPGLCVTVWLSILNLFSLINSVIWRSTDMQTWWSGEGLCDIEVKLIAASYVGVPGALVCLFLGLERVLNTRHTNIVPSRATRWRRRFLEILLCVLVPVIFMVVSFLVQPNRYGIYQVSGCAPVFDQSWLSVVLFYIWPPILCVAAAFFCGRGFSARF